MNTLKAFAAAAKTWTMDRVSCGMPDPSHVISTCDTHRPKGALNIAWLRKQSHAFEVTHFSAGHLWLRLIGATSLQPRARTVGMKLIIPTFPGSVVTLAVRGMIVKRERRHHSESVCVALTGNRRLCAWHLGRYALNHSAHTLMTPALLQRRGFGRIEAVDCVRFDFLRNGHNDHELKKLRFKVYKEAGFLKPTQQSPDDVIDARDAHSHIIVGFCHGSMVASCRAYLMKPADVYEFEPWLTTSALLPPKDQSVELGRAAIESSFRNAGLPTALFRLLAAYSITSDRRYMVLGTSEELIPMYLRYGFVVTPMRFFYPAQTPVPGVVLIADLKRLWLGLQGSPLTWYALFGPKPPDDTPPCFGPVGPLQAVRIGCLKRFGPLNSAARRIRAWRGHIKRALAPAQGSQTARSK